MNTLRNIIFDLGNVIIDLDFDRTIQAFRTLGATDFHLGLDHDKQIFHDYEVGACSTADFLSYWQQKLPQASQQDIIDAWNALLVDIPSDTLDLVNSLKESYRLFVYSNTNELHIRWVKQFLKSQHNITEWDGSLFEKVYYSHEINTRKPEAEGFELILKNHDLCRSETLFIDDHLPNIQAALRIGLQALHKPAYISLHQALHQNYLIQNH